MYEPHTEQTVACPIDIGLPQLGQLHSSKPGLVSVFAEGRLKKVQNSETVLEDSVSELKGTPVTTSTAVSTISARTLTCNSSKSSLSTRRPNFLSKILILLHLNLIPEAFCSSMRRLNCSYSESE